MGRNWTRRAAGALVVACACVALLAAPAVAAKGDGRIVAAGLLRLDDFEPGWRQTPADNNDEDVRALAEDAPECKTYLKIRQESHSLPRRVSPTFTQGDNRSLENTVIVYPTDARAQRALRIYQSPSVAKCLRVIYPKLVAASLIKSSPSVAAQLDSVDVEIGLQSVAPRGDEVVSYSVTITARLKSGLTDSSNIEAQTVRVGRAISDFTIRDDNGEFPLGDNVAGILDAPLSRLQAAL